MFQKHTVQAPPRKSIVSDAFPRVPTNLRWRVRPFPNADTTHTYKQKANKPLAPRSKISAPKTAFLLIDHPALGALTFTLKLRRTSL